MASHRNASALVHYTFLPCCSTLQPVYRYVPVVGAFVACSACAPQCCSATFVPAVGQAVVHASRRAVVRMGYAVVHAKSVVRRRQLPVVQSVAHPVDQLAASCSVVAVVYIAVVLLGAGPGVGFSLFICILFPARHATRQDKTNTRSTTKQ